MSNPNTFLLRLAALDPNDNISVNSIPSNNPGCPCKPDSPQEIISKLISVIILQKIIIRLEK